MSKEIELYEIPHFKQRFGIFLGLFNQLNNTSYTVKEALKMASMISLFTLASECFVAANETVISREVHEIGSTKNRSFKSLDLTANRKRVLEYIKSNPSVSRRQIAVGCNMPLSGVCGRVNELLKLNLVFASGEREDPISNKKVEVLSVTGGRK